MMDFLEGLAKRMIMLSIIALVIVPMTYLFSFWLRYWFP